MMRVVVRGMFLAMILVTGGLPGNSSGQDHARDDKAREEMDENLQLPNVPTTTLGGKQFWTDHRWCHGWRLQHNVVTDHWRVIDASSTRRAWGGRLACQKVLDEHCGSQAKTAEHVVVLVHGLLRTTGSMNKLAAAIRRSTPLEPIAFGYASTRAPIAQHAAALNEWLVNLPGNPRISIVGHSLGNIVVRHAIGDWQARDPRGVQGRLDRIVMLGPPNNGSSLATQLSQLGLFEIIAGKSGMELGPHWERVQSRLAVPPCEFAIISGDMSKSSLRNPLTPAKSDLVVTLDETYLPGAKMIAVPVLHSLLPTDAQVIELSLKFLQHESL
jgi:triacylglycerol esterase/lipase EstA (alpha/beta hydrolase family)